MLQVEVVTNKKLFTTRKGLRSTRHETELLSDGKFCIGLGLQRIGDAFKEV